MVVGSLASASTISNPKMSTKDVIMLIKDWITCNRSLDFVDWDENEFGVGFI